MPMIKLALLSSHQNVAASIIGAIWNPFMPTMGDRPDDGFSKHL
jgi:hypothetical protein